MHDAPAFTAFPLDRGELLRRDAGALAALAVRPDARIAPFWRLKPLVREDGGAPAIAHLPGDRFEHASTEVVFLGIDPAGAPVLAAALDAEAEPAGLVPSARFMELREAAAAGMDAGEASILAAARSALAWHATHRFCSQCGAPSTLAHGGWKRLCPACGTEHFPRVSPVVIMLITRGDHTLLGRGPSWPERFYSCLAGFMEPGETIPDAARREAKEEAGVVLGEVSFLMSQPWPFPSSLMLGVRAEALTEEIVLDPLELADARWFSRAEVEAVFAGTHPLARAPHPVAVAHHLLKWWLESLR
jgi:NAD+ diphosphatase